MPQRKGETPTAAPRPPQPRPSLVSFDRPNIRYTIVEKKDPTRQLLQFIEREHAGETGVVYC